MITFTTHTGSDKAEMFFDNKGSIEGTIENRINLLVIRKIKNLIGVMFLQVCQGCAAT